LNLMLSFIIFGEFLSNKMQIKTERIQETKGQTQKS
jgi:hypothetical protein